MTTLDDLARVERELREQFHFYCDDVETASVARHIERAANTIAAYIASAKAASQPEAAPAQNSEAVTTGWRPIETAPRCSCCPESEAWVKSCLLGRFDGHGWITWVGQMDSGMWIEGNSRRGFGDSETPTHWMPLPETPQANEKEKGDG